MQGKTCVVTGASQGIGLAIGLRLARAGANIVACARHDQPLREAAGQIEALGVGCEPVVGDVARPGFGRQLVEAAVKRFGRVDALVNTAGYAVARPVEQVGPAEFQRMVATNVGAVFYLTRAVFAVMKAQKQGVIINILWPAPLDQPAGYSVHAACNAWVDSFCRAVADEGWPLGIRVHALAMPGPPKTPVPVEPIPEAQEAAAVVEALCDQRLDWTAGQTLFLRRRPQAVGPGASG
jgi:NAD(P)-dependent dehydrogenase (short-subunit alcohol dehydrogenase family)